MGLPIHVPDEAVRYILLQRTGYLRFPIAPLYRHVLRRIPFNLPTYNLVTTAEARLRGSHIKALYSADMHAEYRTFREFLPDRCSSILDIGCGVAGIDVLLDRHYADNSAQIHLLDRSQVERSVYYMFNDRAAFYTSLEVAKDLLVANGVSGDRIHLHEVRESNEIAVSPKVDLVISLLSWGFHYPVDTYAEQVRALLSERGIVVLDIRKETGGIEALQRTFEQVTTIHDAGKYVRVAARPTPARNTARPS